jgi:predicted amidohydrolase YtcJ
MISLSMAAPGISLMTAEAASPQPAVAEDPATTVFYNADVVTVADSQPAAQALAVRGGLVLAVGSRDEVTAVAGSNVILRDLKGKTIVPGLIDAHGHLSMTSTSMGFANVQPPPAGPVRSIVDLQRALRQWQQDNPASEWILGWGYDDSLLAEGRHPTRKDLDQVSKDKPVFLVHVSGHLLACNSKCLELADISAATENPAGGVIQRFPGGNEPNGVVEENAMWSIYRLLPQPTPAQSMALMDKAQQYMASHGITTVQDGAVMAGALPLLQEAASSGRFYLDVVAYSFLKQGDTIPAEFAPADAYTGHFRIGGIKLVLDGSPQGKTAWLTRPYLHPPAGESKAYLGYPTMEDGTVNDLVESAFSRSIPLLAHANGDAAADQYIAAVTAANAALGRADRRPVMIHAQTVREDQLDQMRLQGITPSYFVSHTFFWGDWHRDSVFGETRAARISPLRSTQERGMRFTTHNDTPVTPPDMMRLLWSGVNRLTRSGQVLGPEQRVAPLAMLKSMTIDAAYQYFEEDRKGSIEAGKVADLVVLSANPLKVAAADIKDIQVLETIKEGKTVYVRQPQ